MGTLPWYVRFRRWLALSVFLEITYILMGERPLFCDLASGGCPLDAIKYDSDE